MQCSPDPSLSLNGSWTWKKRFFYDLTLPCFAFSHLFAVSFRCLFCNSSMTRSVSLAWCGRYSFNKWWIWTNNKVKSSIFSVRRGDSGILIRISIRSKKLTSKEWLSFFNSFFRSKCCGYRRRICWLSRGLMIVSSFAKLFLKCFIQNSISRFNQKRYKIGTKWHRNSI